MPPLAVFSIVERFCLVVCGGSRDEHGVSLMGVVEEAT